MKRFCRRSYSRPMMALSPIEWPEYEYEPVAYPDSLNPASAVSTLLVVGAGAAAGLAVVSAAGGPPLWAASRPPRSLGPANVIIRPRPTDRLKPPTVIRPTPAAARWP